MEIGTKIKNLRLERNITQEALAEHLGVTAQAVSKWERGVAAPDISLLPELSVFFGVRIDDLFELSNKERMERIERMLEHDGGILSKEDFEYAERFLKDLIADEPNNAEAIRMLVDLYLGRAADCHTKAEALCKRAIELEPTEKEGHSLLSFAAYGACWDWCCSHHYELIDYYYDFVAKHPDYKSGYFWLLSNLLADGRLDEAEQVVDQMEPHLGDDTCYIYQYRGEIAARQGDMAAAEACWQTMKDRWPEDWLIWSFIGDAHAKLARYDEAVEYYKKAAELEPAPRYCDNWISIAEIRTIQKRWVEAAEAYDHVVEIQKNDWNMEEDSAGVQKIRRKAREMRSKL